MFEYTIKFLATTSSLEITFSSSKEPIEEVISELIYIFLKKDDSSNETVVSAIQKNTLEIRQQLDIVIQKFKSKYPEMNRITAFFRKLPDECFFIFLPNTKLSSMEKIKLYSYLKAKHDGSNFDEDYKQIKDLYENFLENYSVALVGPNRESIGNPDKKSRVCRFCKNKNSPVTFNSKAHAISEALGNKTIILYDECDECNNKFSRNVEPDIIVYLSLFRTIYNIKGKGGSKQFKGSNFELKEEDSLLLTLTNGLKSETLPFSIELNTNESIAFQNIYKCLAKYFLSVIEDRYLCHFSQTIDWINNDTDIKQLPLISELISYNSFDKQPKLSVYIRQNNDTRLPFAVGEFHFACKIFVFILPLSNKDDRDFTTDEDFHYYWNAFKHLNSLNDWSFIDYSSSAAKKFSLKLNIELSKPIQELINN